MTHSSVDPILGSIPDLRRILLAHAYRIGIRSPEERQDIVQDTLLNLWKARSRIDPNQNVVSFAMTTLHRVVLNNRRAANSPMRKKTWSDMPTITPPVNGANLEIAQVLAIADKILLPTEKKNVIMAALGYDSAERGAACGWPPQSANARLSQSRRKLVAAMAA